MADPNQPQPTQPQEEHKCVKCGKIIKPDMAFTHQGQIYCCGDCCKRPDSSKQMCEFC